MSSSLKLRQVHVYKKVPGKNVFALAEIHPAIRLGSGEEHLYIQNGAVFTEGGDPVLAKDYPGWFVDAAAKLNPKVLQETGFSLNRPAKG